MTHLPMMGKKGNPQLDSEDFKLLRTMVNQNTPLKPHTIGRLAGCWALNHKPKLRKLAKFGLAVELPDGTFQATPEAAPVIAWVSERIPADQELWYMQWANVQKALRDG